MFRHILVPPMPQEAPKKALDIDLSGKVWKAQNLYQMSRRWSHPVTRVYDQWRAGVSPSYCIMSEVLFVYINVKTQRRSSTTWTAVISLHQHTTRGFSLLQSLITAWKELLYASTIHHKRNWKWVGTRRKAEMLTKVRYSPRMPWNDECLNHRPKS